MGVRGEERKEGGGRDPFKKINLKDLLNSFRILGGGGGGGGGL